MKLELTENQHPQNPLITRSIDRQEILDTDMMFFDKDGYEINLLEQKFYAANNVNIGEHHLHHTANHVWWIRDTEMSEQGCVIDHSIINTRWAYADAAREDLLRAAERRPVLHKLLSIVPKWGIDFSVDYVSQCGCMELFHIELDRFDLDEVTEYKHRAETIILNTDWPDAAQSILARRHEWQDLSSDDQSDWKAQYLGWHRAFDNRKVFIR